MIPRVTTVRVSVSPPSKSEWERFARKYRHADFVKWKRLGYYDTRRVVFFDFFTYDTKGTNAKAEAALDYLNLLVDNDTRWTMSASGPGISFQIYNGRGKLESLSTVCRRTESLTLAKAPQAVAPWPIGKSHRVNGKEIRIAARLLRLVGKRA